jgi:MscS family membrane protein
MGMNDESRPAWCRHGSGLGWLAGSLATLLAPGAALAQSTDQGDGQPAEGEATVEVSVWIEDSLPDYFVNVQLWDISLWQWIALLALVFVAYMLGYLVARLAVRGGLSLARRTTTPWDDILIERSAAPARLVLSLLIFYLGTLALGLTSGAEGSMAVIAKMVAVFAATWLAMRLVDLFANFADQKLDVRGDAGTKTLVPMGRRIVKVFLFAIAVLSLLQNLGFNITSILAGLGIGGLAVALAAQKTLENVFGGLMVVLDRPVKIGDFCAVGDHMGTIEDIGMRSSRLRTLDRTVVSIPNSEFSNDRIENYTVRDRFFLKTVLQVGYDTTPDQMRYLLVEFRRMLHAHPKVLPTPLRTRFVNFGAHSLDIEIFAYIAASDFNDFTAAREDIFLRIMDIVDGSGAYFAYPSQTLYLGRDAGRDLEKSERAEAVVRELRDGGRLPMPDFAPADIEAMDDSIVYPPEGSALRAPAT